MARRLDEPRGESRAPGSALTKAAPSSPARPWEIRVAWLLRLLIVATAVAHLAQGAFLYALLCLVVIGVLVAPPLLARTSRANLPLELELVALWGAVGDMTLGRLAGLYGGTAWFDKLLHFGNSVLIGILAFLVVYALHLTGRLRTSAAVDVAVIVLLALGIGAFWEIAEYVADLIFGQGAQGSPVLDPLDDTMWDLILDGAGGLLGALLGSAYLRWSTRSACRIRAFAELVPDSRGNSDTGGRGSSDVAGDDHLVSGAVTDCGRRPS